MIKKLFLCLILLFTTNHALALELIVGKVTVVESSYMPHAIYFKMDTGNVSCPTGAWLIWAKIDENNKAVHATVLAAVVSGRKLSFYIQDGDTTCHGQHIYLSDS